MKMTLKQFYSKILQPNWIWEDSCPDFRLKVFPSQVARVKSIILNSPLILLLLGYTAKCIIIYWINYARPFWSSKIGTKTSYDVHFSITNQAKTIITIMRISTSGLATWRKNNFWCPIPIKKTTNYWHLIKFLGTDQIALIIRIDVKGNQGNILIINLAPLSHEMALTWSK